MRNAHISGPGSPAFPVSSLQWPWKQKHSNPTSCVCVDMLYSPEGSMLAGWTNSDPSGHHLPSTALLDNQTSAGMRSLGISCWGICVPCLLWASLAEEGVSCSSQSCQKFLPFCAYLLFVFLSAQDFSAGAHPLVFTVASWDGAGNTEVETIEIKTGG